MPCGFNRIVHCFPRVQRPSSSFISDVRIMTIKSPPLELHSQCFVHFQGLSNTQVLVWLADSGSILFIMGELTSMISSLPPGIL